jgi:hypothetical protein
MAGHVARLLLSHPDGGDMERDYFNSNELKDRIPSHLRPPRYVVGPPVATNSRSAADLAAAGYVGIYIDPRAEHTPDDAAASQSDVLVVEAPSAPPATTNAQNEPQTQMTRQKKSRRGRG